MSSKPLAAL